MKKNLITILIIIWVGSGCAVTNTTQPEITKTRIMNDYLAKVTKYDGIDAQEAILIAQSEFIFRGYENNYHIEYPNIEFEDESRWGIRFYPINKTRADVISNPSILIVINKKDGSVNWHSQGLSFLFIDLYK